jgi:O-antigen/teichoic acid export membrane protein
VLGLRGRLAALLRGHGDAGTFAQNFQSILGANVIAAILPVLATPITTRLFGPNDFGLFSLFVAASALIATVATWRYDWLIPNASHSREAGALLLLGSVILLAIVVALSGALSVAAPWVERTPLGPLGGLVWLLPLSVLLSGVAQLLTGWLTRSNDLQPVGQSTIIRAAVAVVATLAFGYAGLGAVGLIIAVLLSVAVGIVPLWRVDRGDIDWIWRSRGRALLWAASRRHSVAASWSTLVSLVNTASQTAPVFVVGLVFGAVDLGYYALMHRLASAPISILANALGQSFWSHAADLGRKGNYRDLAQQYRDVTRKLIILSIPLVIMCLAAPLYVKILLGDRWDSAGTVLSAMTPMLVGAFVFAPTNHLVVFGAQAWQLVVDTLRIVLMAAGFLLAAWLGWSFVTAVALASFGSLASYALLYVIHLGVHKKHVDLS